MTYLTIKYLCLLSFGLVLLITGIRAVLTGKFSYRGTKASLDDDGDFWIPVIAFIVLGGVTVVLSVSAIISALF